MCAARLHEAKIVLREVEASLKTELYEAEDPEIGRVLADRYRLETLLGEGGIGRVYAGTHLKLGRRVAIKILHEAYRENEALTKRFEREAMVLSALSHPNVVNVIDYGVDNDVAFIAMELIEGKDLTHVIEEGPMPLARAERLIRQILRGLAYAHDRGLIHRDLKPPNIMIRALPDGAEHVYVLDFGLAKFLVEEANDHLTHSGSILGTPAYMSPEQSSAEPTDARTDVYAAGLIFYEMLAGKSPFHSLTGMERTKRQLTGPPPSLKEALPNLPLVDEIDAILAKAIAPRKADRFEDARAMLLAFDALPSHSGDELDPEEKAARAQKERFRNRLKLSAYLTGASTVALALGLGIGLLGTPRTETIVLGQPVIGDLGYQRPEPRDPWKTPMPPELEEFKRAIDTGQTPSRRELAPVYRYMRFHPTDARPNLILAQTFYDRAWMRDAIAQYVAANKKDPTARGAPRMMTDLVALAMDENRSREAAAALREIYREEALPVLDARLAMERDAAVKSRLLAVIAHIESTGPNEAIEELEEIETDEEESE